MARIVPPIGVTSDAPSLAAKMRPALVTYFARKTGNVTEAEDLAQDVLARALAHATWSSAEEARGYIFRAAVNRWRDRCRRLGAQPVLLPLEEFENEESGSPFSPERVLVSKEEFRLIDRALNELNLRTKAVLLLVKVERMKISTVADMLGISSRAVDKHLAKALAHLLKARDRQERS
jgi:RNA polymerase sigma-70 factor (ECF subfamily)